MFDDDMTLKEARDILREIAMGRGGTCPCCTQRVKVYRRKLPVASAQILIELFREDGADDYVYVPKILDRMTGTPAQGGYGTLSVHWGLIASMEGERDDGSNRTGWWKLTEEGVRFVLDAATVPERAHIYNGRCLGHSGPPIDIRQALRNRFDYDELMSA